jgi:hypothetical protein
VKSAQAFRPHVLDKFEPQDHPDDIPYPGGPPSRPYDSAGWTLAYQMGVKVDRIVDAFDGPLEKVSGLAKPLPGKVTTAATAGYTFSHAVNDSFTAINRLIAAAKRCRCRRGRAGDVLRRDQGDDGRGGGQDCADLGLNFEGCRHARRATRSGCASYGLPWRISTAGRCRRAGRAGCSNSSSSHSRLCFRRPSTPAISPAVST